MRLEPFVAEHGAFLAAILMAAVTYLWRGGGFFLMGFIKPHRRISAALAALPGSVIVATVLPIALRNGPAAWLALAAVIAVMAWRRYDLLAVAAGMATIVGLRAAGF
jgi:uncharacterized membrane protein